MCELSSQIKTLAIHFWIQYEQDFAFEMHNCEKGTCFKCVQVRLYNFANF